VNVGKKAACGVAAFSEAIVLFIPIIKSPMIIASA
jgi:hypothetical protein